MPPPRKRPMGITLLALPFLWIGFLGTPLVPFMIPSIGRQLWDGLSPQYIHSRSWALVVVSLGLLLWYSGYVFYAFLGVALWKLHRWALKAMVIVQYITIASTILVALVFGKYAPWGSLCLILCICVVQGTIIWYLKRPSVRAAFDPNLISPPVVYDLVEPYITPAPNESIDHNLIAPITPVGVPLPPAALIRRKPMWPKVVLVITVCVTLFALFFAALFSAVEKSFRTSEPYKIAMTQARNSPCVVRQLGVPISQKGFIEGSINESNADGSADLQFPIHGPKATASIHVEAKRSGAIWQINSLTVFVDDGQIHLLPEPSSCP